MFYEGQTTRDGIVLPSNLGRQVGDIKQLSMRGLDLIHLQPRPDIPPNPDELRDKSDRRKDYGPDKADGFSQSFFDALDTLVDTFVENEDLLVSMKDDDRSRLNAVRDKLSNFVSKGENYLLAPLMDVIDSLIEKHEGEEDMNRAVNSHYKGADAKWETTMSHPGDALDVAYSYDEPEQLTEEMLGAINPDYKDADAK